MKKSLVALLLTLGMLLPLQACSWGANDSSSGSPIDSTVPNADTVTITFQQNGHDDVVKKVKKGETLTDIPVPEEKTGYDVQWNPEDIANLVNITENIVVEAVETANTYTVTYDAGEGTASVTTQDIEYDSTPTLATATRDGYTFTGWEYNGAAVLSEAKWKIAQNVTLKASWTKVEQKFTVTFRQQGQTDKVFPNIVEGSNFTDIPATIAKTGYTVQWKSADLDKLKNVTENIVVEAVETAKTYTVVFDSNGGTLPENQTTITVTYGETYELPSPKKQDDKFLNWKYGERKIDLKGTWNIDADGEIKLVADWNGETWTKFY